MIIIISQAEGEQSTVMVMDWLHHRNARYRRLNGMDAIQNFTYTINANGDHYLHCDDDYFEDVFSEEITVWFRRWMGRHVPFHDSVKYGEHNFLNTYNFVRQERAVIREHFLQRLQPTNSLGNPHKDGLNKLEALVAAGKAGLTVPRTIVTTSREELISFCRSTGGIIVKSLKDPAMLSHIDAAYVSYTATLTEEDILSLPATFFPSLVQEHVQKDFEIRIFYLDGDCYAMAIFSQSNQKTQVDFRKYDKVQPNRNVPYTLPPAVIKSIQQLMTSLELNCGSIDIIKSTDGKYYFLEVNPVGQFGMVSYPCNYFLEEKVADWLIKKDNQ